MTRIVGGMVAAVPAPLSENLLSVTSVSYMFRWADAFDQNLSVWCVSLITSEPTALSCGASSWTEPQPDWGTCP